MSDAREELTYAERRAMEDDMQRIALKAIRNDIGERGSTDARAARRVAIDLAAAGYSKRTPGGEAGQDDVSALKAGLLAVLVTRSPSGHWSDSDADVAWENHLRDGAFDDVVAAMRAALSTRPAGESAGVASD